MSIFTTNEIKDYLLTKGVSAIEQILSNVSNFATTWSRSGDMAISGGNAVYTDSGNSGSLTQAIADMSIAPVLDQWYRFDYRIASSTGDCAATITTAFAAAAKALDLTDGDHTVYVLSHETSITAFVIAVTSSAGGFTMDNFSLNLFEGASVVNATNVQTYALKVEAEMPTSFVAKDPRIIRALESVERPIMLVVNNVWGMSLTEAQISAWIKAYMPDQADSSDFLANVIVQDLAFSVAETADVGVSRTYPLGSSITQTIPTLSSKQLYLEVLYKVLTDITKYMRHFATLDQLDDNGLVVLTGLQDIF